MNPVPSSGAPRIYPMRYRMLVAALWAAVALTPPYMMLTTPGWTQRNGTFVVICCVLGLLVTLAALGFLGDALRYRFILETDAIEQVGLFSKRRVERSQIAGYRQSDQAQFDLTLQLHDGKSISFPRYFPIDPVLQAWLNRLPDLDQADYLGRVQQVEGNPLLGATPSERAANHEKSDKLAGLLTMAGLGLCVVGLFYPRPYALVIGLAMALPMLALAIRWRQPERYTFDFDKRDARASLAMVFLFPVALLAPRAWQDVHMVSWLPLAIPALIGGALIASMAGLEKKLSWHNVMCVAMTSVYLAASAVFINTAFDKLPAASTAVQVVDKAREEGSKGSRFLMLAVPGTAAATKFTASKAEYEQFEKDDRACLVQHPGRLGMAWFAIEACAGGDAPLGNVP